MKQGPGPSSGLAGLLACCGISSVPAPKRWYRNNCPEKNKNKNNNRFAAVFSSRRWKIIHWQRPPSRKGHQSSPRDPSEKQPPQSRIFSLRKCLYLSHSSLNTPPPFAMGTRFTGDSKDPAVNVTTWVLLVTIVCSVSARLLTKFRLFKKLTADDLLIAASLVCLCLSGSPWGI